MTAMKIPLQVYHGKLHCQVEHGDFRECSDSNLDLNMGTISVTESRKKHINITNLNPVNVTVETISCTHSSVNLHMEVAMSGWHALPADDRASRVEQTQPREFEGRVEQTLCVVCPQGRDGCSL